MSIERVAQTSAPTAPRWASACGSSATRDPSADTMRQLLLSNDPDGVRMWFEVAQPYDPKVEALDGSVRPVA
jgi:hypothetical protein